MLIKIHHLPYPFCRLLYQCCVIEYSHVNRGFLRYWYSTIRVLGSLVRADNLMNTYNSWLVFVSNFSFKFLDRSATKSNDNQNVQSRNRAPVSATQKQKEKKAFARSIHATVPHYPSSWSRVADLSFKCKPHGGRYER